jgi:putative DNA primase/helicase
MFDGCLIYETNIDRSTLDEIEYQINSQFSGLNMKLLVKSHNKDIEMPDDFEVIDSCLENMKTFDKVVEEFEKTHCKILDKAIFIRKRANDNIVFSKQQFKCAYEHMVYEKLDKDNKIIKMNFINDWMNNNPSIRCYDDIGVYPNDSECPTNIYNMWRPFEMENVTEFEYKQSELNIILNHIRILCDNDDNVYQYFVSWIGQMIQYPSVKTICPTLISGEGAGKGTLLKLFGKMLGESKVYETTNPSRDVWGDFNGCMCNTFLVNFNELSKKETLECEGRIKGLITDPKQTINNKGVNQFTINSFHRFIITTNNHEPINTKKGDRRQLVIRSSDEKCGDKEYFKMLHEILEDVNVIKTCYEYFKSIPDLDKFNSLPIPITAHQEVLKELGECVIETWLRQFTLDNFEHEFVEMYAKEVFDLFVGWCKENKVDYNINVIKFGVRLINLKIDGVKHGRPTKNGVKRLFNIDELKAHFNINWEL